MSENTSVITGCLKSTQVSYLPFLAEISPPKLRHDTSCLSLYTKAKPVDHLLHRTLYIQLTPTRLKSRRLLRLYVEHLEREGIALPQVPSPLKLYINELTLKPDGYLYPAKAWVQLNRLRTAVGRFKANMVKMDLAASNQCQWSTVQTAEYMLQECHILRPPCSISKMNREDLLQYLLNIDFWGLLALYCLYERRRMWKVIAITMTTFNVNECCAVWFKRRFVVPSINLKCTKWTDVLNAIEQSICRNKICDCFFKV